MGWLSSILCRNSARPEKERQWDAGYMLLILPAVSLGILAMICSGISPALWGQQAAAWLLFALLAQPLRCACRRISYYIWSVLLLIVLAATLFGSGLDGIKRWLDLGVMQVNASMLVLPAMIAVLYTVKYPHPVLLAAVFVLCLQPDLSQLTAFALACLPLLWKHRERRLWSLAGIILSCAAAVRCICTPAAIEPVPYCEGILAMLGEVSWILQAAGYAALAAVPLLFIYRFCVHGRLHMLSWALYYAVMLLFSLSGDYPVPFMGFGLSPIAGYYLAYICSPSSEA